MFSAHYINSLLWHTSAIIVTQVNLNSTYKNCSRIPWFLWFFINIETAAIVTPSYFKKIILRYIINIHFFISPAKFAKFLLNYHFNLWFWYPYKLKIQYISVNLYNGRCWLRKPLEMRIITLDRTSIRPNLLLLEWKMDQFQRAMWPVRGFNHPLTCSGEVKGKVEIKFYSTFGSK